MTGKLLLAAAVVAAVAARSVWLDIAIGVAWAGAYRYSLRRRPMRPCRTCHGSGANHGQLWRQAYGPCWCCHGAKGHPRWGVRVFYRQRYQQLTSGRRR